VRIRWKPIGIDVIKAQLRNTAEKVSDTARKTMHRGADKIVKEAKLNAPVDKHNLEESIRKVVGYGYRGRVQINIEVGGMINGVNVDLYAVEVHENYWEDTPGPGTLQKRQQNPGRHVGGKYLERAVNDQRPKLEKDVIEAVVRTWRL